MKSKNFLKVFGFLQLQLWPCQTKEVISELCWQTSQIVSCFQLIVRYEFPKDCVHYEGSDLIFTWVISHTLFDAAEERIPCGWFNLKHCTVSHQTKFHVHCSKKAVNAAYAAENAKTLLFIGFIVFVSNGEWRTVLENNVFWKHLIGSAVGKIHTAAQSQLKWLIRLLHLGSHGVKITALHWFPPNNLIGGLFC